MLTKKSSTIGVLMGGLSPEKEISLKSGEQVYLALKSRGYLVKKVFVDRDIDQVLRQDPIDFAFIALHGSYGEDGCIQGFLELMGIPYTGSNVLASALAMDKVKAKEMFRFYNVPTPPYYQVDASHLPKLRDLHAAFGFPVFVKPRAQGSTIGAGKAENIEELRVCCEQALQYGQYALIERFIDGKEIAVGVLHGKSLGAIEIVPKGKYFDYKSKYTKGHSEYIYPASLSSNQYRAVLGIAEQANRAVGGSGATRVDMLVSSGGNEYVLEVNTVPGLASSSGLLPKVAAGAGLSFEDLCEAMLPDSLTGKSSARSREDLSADQQALEAAV